MNNLTILVKCQLYFNIINAEQKGLLSDENLLFLQWIMFGSVCQVINISGIVTNIINIICFTKQGFADTINISLLGLTCSDLCGLVTLVWICISYTPGFEAADLSFDAKEVSYISAGMLHVTFSRITCFITAFITLERCLCIAFPLKVKIIMTKTRTSIINICIFVLPMSSFVPLYAVNRLGFKFFPDRNKTLLGIIYTPDRDRVENISFYVNMFLPFIAFVVIISCTFILVIKLREHNTWHRRSAATAQTANASQRNKKVAQMVVMISLLFITCFIPISITFVAVTVEPSLSIVGENKNMLILLGGICFILEAFNSSANIIVYYCVSTRYRETFLEFFCTGRSDYNSMCSNGQVC